MAIGRGEEHLRWTEMFMKSSEGGRDWVLESVKGDQCSGGGGWVGGYEVR